ncbi:MAG: hypothetical protein HY291_12860 [Planctomycetes bacterium]|nr:hypothetical protein [Planctomycetota bacterium]
MSRTLLAVLFSVCCAWVFTPASAHALSIPGVKDKEKKTEEKKAPEAKTAEQPAAQSEKKTEPAAAPKNEEAPAPAAGNVSTSETTISKEAWDEYKKYKVGAFVEYSMPAQADMKMRYEVLEVTDTTMTILTTTSSPQFKQQAKIKYVLKADSTEKVSAAGKEFTATKTETTTDGKLTMRSWTTKEIPQFMGGVVKTEGGDGKVMMVLSAYGEGK